MKVIHFPVIQLHFKDNPQVLLKNKTMQNFYAPWCFLESGSNLASPKQKISIDSNKALQEHTVFLESICYSIDESSVVC